MSSKIRICLLLVGLLVLVFGKEVGAQSGSGYSLATSVSTVAPGSTITVLWQAPSTHATRDWIGLFLAGAPSAGHTVIAYKYVPSGTSGAVTFTAPNLEMGRTYQVRYLLNDGYQAAAATSTITVANQAPTTPSPTAAQTTPTSTPTTPTGTQTQTSSPTSPSPAPSATYAVSATPAALSAGGAISVSWQAPSTHGTRDWIGLFLAGRPSAGNTIITWKYVPGGTSGVMTFAAPNLEPNQVYEFRYLLNDGYTKTAASNPIRLATGGATPPNPGTAVPSTTVPSTTSPTPTAPAGSSGTPATSSPQSATLRWMPSSSSDVAAYNVYRSTRSGVYGAPIATITQPMVTYQATGLQLNTTYYFVVTAVDQASNESAYSNEVSKSIY